MVPPLHNPLAKMDRNRHGPEVVRHAERIAFVVLAVEKHDLHNLPPHLLRAFHVAAIEADRLDPDRTLEVVLREVAVLDLLRPRLDGIVELGLQHEIPIGAFRFQPPRLDTLHKCPNLGLGFVIIVPISPVL